MNPNLRIGLIALLVLLSACSGDTSAPVSVQSPSSNLATPTLEPTATDILTGPIATMNALNAQVTVNPKDSLSRGIEEDDFVGLFILSWTIIRDNYVRDDFNGVDWDQVYEDYLPKFTAISNQIDHWEMMEELVKELKDPHSRFNAPLSTSPMPSTGLNILPSKEEEDLYIWYVCATGSGASAGLRRGDLITEIDGIPVQKTGDKWEKEDYRAAVFGNEGKDEVTLTVMQGPDADPISITLKLSGAAGCDGWQRYLVSDEPKIGVIRVPTYRSGVLAERLILQGLRDLEEDGSLDGLIIDQRHNPGGTPGVAESIFAKGVVGKLVKFREDSVDIVFRILGPVEWNTTTPMVVLTDGQDYSSAEIFPASLRELGRATIIGMPTNGESEEVGHHALPDGSLIYLSDRAFILNDGSSFEGIGVMPDIFVPLGEWGLRQLPYDIQLQAAIDFLLNQ